MLDAQALDLIATETRVLDWLALKNRISSEYGDQEKKHGNSFANYTCIWEFDNMTVVCRKPLRSTCAIGPSSQPMSRTHFADQKGGLQQRELRKTRLSRYYRIVDPLLLQTSFGKPRPILQALLCWLSEGVS